MNISNNGEVIRESIVANRLTTVASRCGSNPKSDIEIIDLGAKEVVFEVA